MSIKNRQFNAQEYRHIKTGKPYYRLATVINATNANDQQTMVLYEDIQGTLFVREKMEFDLKFRKVDIDSPLF